MQEIKFEPVGKAYLSTAQKRERYIKKLEYWVIVLGIADVLFTILTIVLLWEVIG